MCSWRLYNVCCFYYSKKRLITEHCSDFFLTSDKIFAWNNELSWHPRAHLLAVLLKLAASFTNVRPWLTLFHSSIMYIYILLHLYGIETITCACRYHPGHSVIRIQDVGQDPSIAVHSLFLVYILNAHQLNYQLFSVIAFLHVFLLVSLCVYLLWNRSVKQILRL